MGLAVVAGRLVERLVRLAGFVPPEERIDVAGLQTAGTNPSSSRWEAGWRSRAGLTASGSTGPLTSPESSKENGRRRSRAVSKSTGVGASACAHAGSPGACWRWQSGHQ